MAFKPLAVILRARRPANALTLYHRVRIGRDILPRSSRSSEHRFTPTIYIYNVGNHTCGIGLLGLGRQSSVVSRGGIITRQIASSAL